MKLHTARTVVTLTLAGLVSLAAAAQNAPPGAVAGGAPARGGAAPAPTSTPAIAGVVNAGTPIQLIKEGFEAVEGPMKNPDGSVLFTNNSTGQVLRAAPDGTISTWFEGPFGANALARTPKGEVVATLQKTSAIGVIAPGAQPRVLFDKYDGKPFNRPNDIVADRRGNLYFTDSVPLGATGTPAIPSSVYQVTADGKLVLISADVPRPNGVALSPDDRTLYVANTAGEHVIAFALDANGTAGARRDFAKLNSPAPRGTAAPASGADGIAVDAAGRLFVATSQGVQVVSPAGEHLGTIALGRQPQNLAFGGPGNSSLYVVGRGAVYKIDTLTKGPERQGK